MGGFNAKVMKGSSKHQGLGFHDLGERNSKASIYFPSLKRTKLMMILNTLFICQKRRKHTWISPKGVTNNHIDYILVSESWFSTSLNCNTKPSADFDADHTLLKDKLKVKWFV
ncbi:endonuclease-reverse transcriptase [Plakobranchus ocellatus]|uniref:Endonuclease-reverse transcriptase n=1 Tax=Plakobranchus ocellatus TaxID=259542 RepID=A0AAV3Z2M7_9GAST|nr:endonuclease-reverse transcriptase [Plakobranchus ocellatus]